MTLRLSRPGADVYVPDGDGNGDGDGADPAAALAGVTHLGIAAHADDLEIMAYHGIRLARSEPGARFGGVVCTDGRGAPRTGRFTDTSDEAMRDLRREEQREAARRGGYAAVVQLDHPSASLKQGVSADVVDDLAAVLGAARPQVVYTHNPMDAHVTHLGACVASIEAVRRLPADARPARVLGCEGWRGLDWLPASDKTHLDLGREDAHWSGLIRAFASQTDGGRPYDEGALGRARANAVFRESHDAGGDERLWLAVDLTPTTRDGGPNRDAFVAECLERFGREVRGALAKVRGR
ncbi:MAG: PIG-L deacetylase family protein [Myxococcota bacterium]